VYIRIEDSVNEFSFGFKIPSISMLPCDKQWKKVEQVDDVKHPIQYKSLTIHNLEVFINTTQTPHKGFKFIQIS